MFIFLIKNKKRVDRNPSSFGPTGLITSPAVRPPLSPSPSLSQSRLPMGPTGRFPLLHSSSRARRSGSAISAPSRALPCASRGSKAPRTGIIARTPRPLLSLLGGAGRLLHPSCRELGTETCGARVLRFSLTTEFSNPRANRGFRCGTWVAAGQGYLAVERSVPYPPSGTSASHRRGEPRKVRREVERGRRCHRRDSLHHR